VVDHVVALEKLPERLEYGKLKATEEIKSKSYKVQAETQLITDFPQVIKNQKRNSHTMADTILI
jgi:hypothetical protein